MKRGEEFHFINFIPSIGEGKKQDGVISENPNKKSSPRSKTKDFLCQAFYMCYFIITVIFYCEN